MSNFKIEFTLKQHTPIIHFQNNQFGSTLRATELKPKFDKFLLENIKDIPYKKNANGHKSIDYKVKIEPNYNNPQEIKRDPLFFGNMGNNQEKKMFKIYNNEFKIEFFSFDKRVIGAIKSNFEAFLANTNFGSRQSKGYGSFYLANKVFNPKLISKKVYSFNSNNWREDIKLFYSFLRQGINLRTFYTKPAIFLYFKQKGIDWEKKAIKEAILDKKRIDTNRYKIIRDLFGLSTSQRWMQQRITITKGNKNIERFKSPITFKVIDKKIYFWVNDNYKKILNTEFIINKKLKLKTPQSFDFDDFFEYVLNLKLSNIIEKKYQNSKEFKTLNKILLDLRDNL